MIREIFSWFTGLFKTKKRTPEKRKYIPGWRKTRVEVWQNYFGESQIGKCYCCKTTIHFKKSTDGKGWDCSHVKAYIKGGNSKISNLRCCCQTCNRSMGSKNLYKFKKEKGYK